MILTNMIDWAQVWWVLGALAVVTACLVYVAYRAVTWRRRRARLWAQCEAFTRHEARRRARES